MIVTYLEVEHIELRAILEAATEATGIEVTELDLSLDDFDSLFAA